jgi:hypothetical protein
LNFLGRGSSKPAPALVLAAYNEEMSISYRLAPEDDEFDDIDDELDEDDDTDLTAGDEGVDDVYNE